MPVNLGKLINVGFERAGQWVLTQHGLGLEIDNVIGSKRDVLYAFAVDGSLRYIGKTASVLQTRLQGYKTPPVTANSGASTNIKNNRNIIEALKNGSTVEIYVLHELKKQNHGGFMVSLAAGLEDSLIGDLSPLWNGRTLAQIKSATSADPVSNRVPVSDKPNPSVRYALSALEANAVSKIYPSADMLFAFIHTINGQTLETLERRAKFRVSIIGNRIEITPEKSRAPRFEPYEKLSEVLTQLRKTHSFQMSDYQKSSFNASYDLALVRRWQQQHT